MPWKVIFENSQKFKVWKSEKKSLVKTSKVTKSNVKFKSQFSYILYTFLCQSV